MIAETGKRAVNTKHSVNCCHSLTSVAGLKGQGHVQLLGFIQIQVKYFTNVQDKQEQWSKSENIFSLSVKVRTFYNFSHFI